MLITLPLVTLKNRDLPSTSQCQGRNGQALLKTTTVVPLWNATFILLSTIYTSLILLLSNAPFVFLFFLSLSYPSPLLPYPSSPLPFHSYPLALYSPLYNPPPPSSLSFLFLVSSLPPSN